MMKTTTLSGLLVCALLATSCTTAPDWSRAGYDALQTRQRLLDPNADAAPTAAPISYGEYQYERERELRNLPR